MSRFFKGPLNSSKNKKSFKKEIDNLFRDNKGVRTQHNVDITESQTFIYFDSTETETEGTCTQVFCEGCDCTATPTPTPTPTLTPIVTPTPPSPTPTPSSSYNFGPLSFTLDGLVP